jgi:amino acid adenylation domain-containing protein
MSTSFLIQKLRKLNIHLKLEGDQLKVDAPKGMLTQELLTEIRSHKDSILQYLRDARQQRFEAIPPVPPQPHYMLSHAQRRLWVIDQMDPSRAAYNMPFACWLEGDLDREAFTRVFETLLTRHESLRTCFIEEGEEPRQKILPVSEVKFSLGYTDLRAQEDREAKVWAEAEAEGERPFDLAVAPLIRAKLLQVEENRYAFLLTMHHIISDGWSMRVLIEEIYSLYHAYSRGEEVELAPLPIQYKDYAAWQHKELKGEKMQGKGRYWKEKFSGEIPSLNLPTDYARPAVKGYAGRAVERMLSPEMLIDLNEMAQAYGGSLYMVLLAGLKALLYRYTGQSDLIVGCPVAGRTHADLEQQVGFYVNTLALRTTFEGEASFSSLLEQVRKTMLEGLQHQEYPFDQLIEELEIPRNLSRSPLFDIMLTLQNTEDKTNGDSTQLSSLRKTDFAAETVNCLFDLQLVVWECEEGLHLNLIYNRDLFVSARMERMLQHFEHLLASAIKNSQLPLTHMEYLGAEEKAQLLTWGAGDVDFSSIPGTSIVECFESQVTNNPDAVALVDADSEFTYAQLNRQVNRLAHHLRESYQIGVEDRVGLMMDRSAWVIIGILGIIKAGAAYVPVDPSLPEKRIAFILNDVDANLVLTDANNFEFLLGFFSGELMALDTRMPEIEASEENPPLVNGPTDLANVIYTSGSTGVPKGVLVEHKGVVRLVKNPNYISFGKGDQLLQTTALSFDVSTFEIWGMLLNGGTLHMVPRKVLMDTTALKAAIRERKISIMWMTTSWFNQVIDEDIEVFEGVNCLLAGGEKLSPLHMKKLLDHYPQIQAINGYGPTENTAFSTCHTIRKRDVSGDSIPIGTPISGSSVFLLDDHFQAVPIGIDAEIFVGGIGVARGYLNQIEQTRQKFIPHPMIPGEILYRTGDVGRWLEDGTVGFEGRKDDQVKIRGYRIELGELEHVIQSFGQIGQAAVLVKSDDAGEKMLVAFFEGEEELAKSIREYLQKNLPAFMIPNYLVAVDKFPLTANGKVNKKALAALDIYQSNTQSYCPPTTDLESRLAEIWEEILNRTKIGITDNFFDLGGHSLRATRVLSKVHKETDVKIDLANFFKNPTIEQLATEIEAIQWINKPVHQEENEGSREGIIL